jgi:CheY-like chemotaxis protein
MTLNTDPGANPATKSHPIRVLLVDDCPVMLHNLGNIMAEERGFHVVGTAKDGLQAVLVAAALMPQLVLIDLHLPLLDGAEATRRLKQFHNPPVVFMITSDDGPSARATIKAVGADALVRKSPDLQAQIRAKLLEWFGPMAGCPQTPAALGFADGLAGKSIPQRPRPSSDHRPGGL